MSERTTYIKLGIVILCYAFQTWFWLVVVPTAASTPQCLTVEECASRPSYNDITLMFIPIFMLIAGTFVGAVWGTIDLCISAHRRIQRTVIGK